MSATDRCPGAGQVVHEREVTASLAYCPECRQLAPVFQTSEPRPYRYRFAIHEVVR